VIRLRRINKHEIDWDKHAGCIQLADGGWAVLEQEFAHLEHTWFETGYRNVKVTDWQPIDITEAE